MARRGFLLALAAIAGGALPIRAEPRAMPGPPLAMDAPAGLDPHGWLASEKYDGVRAVWDGRTLRFRSGLPVNAPAWWLARLPAEPLDGELWAGRGRFEALSGAVRRATPDDAEWRALRYMVFDAPAVPGGFADRAARLQAMAARWPADGPLQVVVQQRIADAADLSRRLAAVLAQGGEGLVLRQPDAPYRPGRSAAMLKLKPVQDDEAEVIGHEPGQGRLAGRLGALRVRSADGIEFRLGTGFSDAQRDAPPPVGARVTYRFRGRTEAGVPRFASFVRERPAGL